MSNARTLAGLIDDTNTRIKIPSGYGLDFADYGAEDSNSATTVGSNLMSDYEIGTWTPTYTTISGNNEPTHTPDILENHYTKIGRMVHVICFIRTDSVDTNSLSSSENLAVGGLPFQTSERSFLTIDNANGWGTNTQRPEYGFIEAGQTKITLTYSERIDLTSSPFYTNNMINGSNANTTAFSFSYLTDS